MGWVGEMTHLPTRLESTFWSWRSGWSFSGGEATAIAAADALRVIRFTTLSQAKGRLFNLSWWSDLLW